MTSVVQPRFVSWLRTGLAAHITSEAVDGLATAATASTEVFIQLRSTGADDDAFDPIVSPPIDLLGPEHVTSLDPAQVLRRSPQPDADDAEPNYLAAIELASAELPWRYTPAAADTDGRLQPWLVLVVVEERDGVTLVPGGGAGLDELRVDIAETELPDLTESWAWAHVHADDELAEGVAAAYAARPDVFRARLMCPRRLTPNTPWIAALVPSFETGRAAGLRIAPTAGTLLAWVQSATDVVLPVYSSWRFRTGPRGDFESLVTRLTPRELPADVGRKALDLSEPGGGLRSTEGATTTYTGALVSTRPMAVRPPDAGLAAIEEQLPKLLNATLTRGALPADYDAAEHDPVVGPTIHAANQAGQRRVPALGDSPVWFGELNAEPHHRAVAGLGAEVVRRDQEALMGAAWEQAAAMQPVNDLLQRSRAAWEVAGVTRARTMAVSDESLMQIAAPAAGRLRLADGTTAFAATREAGIPAGLLSAAFRRRCATLPSFAARPAAGPRIAPTRAVTAACLAQPEAFVATWTATTRPLGADPFDAATHEANVHAIERDIMGVAETDIPDVIVAGQLVADPGGRRPGETSSGRRRDRSRDERAAASNSSSLEQGVRDSLDPQGTIAAMLDARVAGLDPARDHPAPDRLTARPQFTTPMYARLSPELLVPGIGTVPDDTVALLEVNPSFIDAFLAGVNHEMGREFLWREYPARLDATWFQQFWASIDGAPDIAPLRTWKDPTRLGDHRPDSTPDASLVLIVTGALLRRYPDTKVYAVEADWIDGLRFEKEGGEVLLPVFSGDLGPGVRFFGFELDAVVARGSTEESRGLPGYHFVLEEQPHEPRFGFDAPAKQHRGKKPEAWSAMSWSHLAPIGDDPLPTFVDLDGPHELAGLQREGNGGPDVWGADAAAMARITLQRPVRMLVHADSMLPDAGPLIPPIEVELPDGPGDPFDPIGGGPVRPGRPSRPRPTRPSPTMPSPDRPGRRRGNPTQ